LKKDLAIIGGLFALIIFLVIFGQSFTPAAFLREGTPSGVGSIFGTKSKSINAQVKDFKIKVIVADSVNLRKKGLSKRESLPLGEGMLFVFDTNSNWGIWMKDMKFALDIIWINDNQDIIGIAKSVPPQLGKKDSELTVYKPSSSAKYVLEINAGLSELNNINEGDKVNFSLVGKR